MYAPDTQNVYVLEKECMCPRLNAGVIERDCVFAKENASRVCHVFIMLWATPPNLILGA